jgi:phosphate-selective porin OprO/OprP
MLQSEVRRVAHRPTHGFLLHAASVLVIVLAQLAGVDAQAIDLAPAALPAFNVDSRLLSVVSASARPSEASQTKPSIYDKIWRFAEWYDDKSNPVIQRVLFTGRYHHDFAVLDSDSGDHRESNVRRLRMGPRISLFRTFTFHAEVELNPQEPDPLYVRITDFYAQWTKSPAMVFSVGKQSVPFTLDGATSSKELLTIDRSNASNNIWFPEEYIPGVSVSGRRAPWVYRVGMYSGGEANDEFGEFTGGIVTLGVLGYDFADRLGWKEALVAGNYVYQDPDPNNTFTRRLQHVASVSLRLEARKWGARAEASAASGYSGQSDLRSVTAMPFLNVTDKLQVVARYTFITSDAPNGIRLATYESRLVAGRGDRYQELYAGANYYLYGHKLKVQSGIQFPHMRDRANDGGAYSGVSWTTGIRVGW